MAERHRPSALEKATELLARRAHFERELERKLDTRGYPKSEVAAALARLKELGFLDDHNASRELVESRLRRGGEGKRRLAFELARRQARPEAAAEALATLDPAEELARARALAEQFRSRGSEDPAALGRRLDRKGFSRQVILTVLEELGGETEGIPEEDEPP